MISTNQPRRPLLRLLIRRVPRLVTLVALSALTLAACGGQTPTEGTAGGETAGGETENGAGAGSGEPIVVLNHGGDMEGHTPRGFAGSGVGLFAGDELNSRFPPDDGVQIWLTFELPDSVDSVAEATLRSDALSTNGDPFAKLGKLEAAPVRFDRFSPDVFNLEPVGDDSLCPGPQGSAFTCDVTDAVVAEVADGRATVQFRLRFEQVTSPDGQQDLATFFLTDSNTNEPGIFTLELN